MLLQFTMAYSKTVLPSVKVIAQGMCDGSKYFHSHIHANCKVIYYVTTAKIGVEGQC